MPLDNIINRLRVLSAWISIVALALSAILSPFGLDNLAASFALLIVSAVSAIVALFTQRVRFLIRVIGSLLIAAAVLGLGYFSWWSSQPRFEILALNTLDGDKNAYELNDQLIWEQDNLDTYGITLTYTLQIIPSYHGRNQYGRVVALISGDGGILEKTVWDNFTGDSAAEEIHLTLSEILQPADLKMNADPPSNLFRSGDLAFQQTKLMVQIARAADITNPWDGEEITIRNAPWELRSDLVWRNNRREVDVYLKNLGGTGGFTLSYSLVRLDQEIASSSHPMLSGTTSISLWNEPKQLIYLEKSEFFTGTVVLPGQLPPGRYLLEIFPVKEQKFVEFKDTNTTWGNLKTTQCPWCFAGFGPMRYQRLIFLVTASEFPITAKIQTELVRLHDAGIDLGFPLGEVEEITSPRGTVGQRQVFQKGEIYVHNGQAYALYGPILEYYNKMKGTGQDVFGLPISPIQAVVSGQNTSGEMMEFEGTSNSPAAAIYTSEHGVAPASGWIGRRYLEDYDGHNGWLGFPLAGEEQYFDSIIQMFEGGYFIYYYPKVGDERDYGRPPVAYPYLTWPGRASRSLLVDVHAQQFWQDTGIQLQPKDQVEIIQVVGSWTEAGWQERPWTDANGRATDPVNNDAVLPSVPIGTLIGKVGDDDQILPVGRWSVLTSPTEGTLYLAMNDLYDYYDDNEGFITVQIRVEPSE